MTVVAVSLLGCGEPEVATEPQSAVVRQPVASAGARPAAKPAGELLLSLIPEPPTADGCLKVLVSGAQRVTCRWEVNGQEAAGQSSNTLCEGFRRGDEVRAIISDGQRKANLAVTIANAPPRITEVAVNSDAIPRHADLVVKPTVVDVDDDPIEVRYQWYINDEADPLLTEQVLPANRYARGDRVYFTLAASDGTAEGKLYRSETLTVPNAPPQILSQPPQQFEAVEYRYQVKARDPDGDKLVYSLSKAPQGMTVNRATGLVAWPLTGVQPGVYALRVVVRDPAGAEAFQEFNLTLGAPPPHS